MKVIDRKTHGYLDYIVGVLLVAAPWLLGFNNDGPAMWVPVILGAGTILYSLFTDYEMGAFRAIPFGAHLTIDVVSGLFLASSPWLFGFADEVYLPHLVVGILELGVVFMTQPGTEHTRRHTLSAME